MREALLRIRISSKVNNILSTSHNCTLIIHLGLVLLLVHAVLIKYRGPEGLWKKRCITELATPDTFHVNPSLVWEFYSHRRKIATNKASMACCNCDNNISRALKIFFLESLQCMHNRTCMYLDQFPKAVSESHRTYCSTLCYYSKQYYLEFMWTSLASVDIDLILARHNNIFL